MFRSVVVLSCLFCAAAKAAQWTPPEKPVLLGRDYWVESVDMGNQKIIVNGTTITPAEIVAASLPGFLGAKGGREWDDFNAAWFNDMVKAFDTRKPQGPSDIHAFLKTGKSHNQKLRMNIFSGAHNWNYGTHVHQNLEYMTVLAGTLYEHRSDGHVDIFEPTQPLPYNGSFHDEVTAAGTSNFREINEFGSLHTSYTKDDGVLFLTLYNGDWFFGIDGCKQRKFVCTPNGCGKSPNNMTYDELCKKDGAIQLV